MLGKINDAYELVKNGLDVEISLATAEQRGQLADAKLALADIKLTLAELKIENEDLRRSLDEKDHIHQEGACYVKQQDDGQYALCSSCWEGDRLAVSLARVGSSFPYCPRCKNDYKIKEKSRFENLR